MKKLTIEKRKQAEDLIKKLIEKAWDNDTFKEQLVNNPEVVIEQELDSKMTIPEGLKLVVEDQTDSNIVYLNIPRKIEFDDFELTEEDLEKVSGGCGGACVFGIVLGVIQVVDWIGEGWNSVE